MTSPIQAYYAYVYSESDDVVTLVRLGPDGLVPIKVIPVGSFPAEIESPHGITVAPGGRHWFVSLAHGFPYGSVHKFRAGNGNDVIYEVDLSAWAVTWRFEGAGAGPYNLAFDESRDLLVVTYKQSGEVGFWSVEDGSELAGVRSRRLPHGVVITPDGRYSLVTLEGVGSEPGTVEVYDNGSFERVATLDVGKQVGGIALWDGGGE